MLTDLEAKLEDLLTQIEQMVMDRLFWSHIPVMVTVTAGEDWVVALKDRVRAALDACLPVAREFLEVVADVRVRRKDELPVQARKDGVECAPPAPDLRAKSPKDTADVPRAHF